MYLVFKIFLTAIVVVLISEIAKRSTLIAGVVASLPLTSLLAFLWMYYDVQDTGSIRDLSINIFLMIPPSLTFFVVMYFFLGWKLNFFVTLISAIAITAIVYWLYFYILSFLGINLN